MKNSDKSLNVAKPFFLIFLPLFTLATSITAGFLFYELKSQKEILKTGEQQQVEKAIKNSDFSNSNLNTVFSVLKIAAPMGILFKFLVKR